MRREERKRLFEPSGRAMRARYIVALLILAGLALAEYAIMDEVVHAQLDRAMLLARGGRQRVLVQRAALLSQQLVDARDPARRSVVRSELQRTGRALRAAHDSLIGLRGGSPGAAWMQRVYLEDFPRIESEIRSYLRNVDDLSAAPDSALTTGNADFRAVVRAASGGTSWVLDELVGRLIEGTESEIRHMHAVAIGTLLATAVFLALVGGFIFEPMVRRILRKRRVLVRVNETLSRLSAQDALTSVGNRRAFEERIGEEWLRAFRNGTHLSLLMIDIDHFKAYNDRYGHPAGDECLKLLTRDFQARLRRPADFLARYGGEEFAILLPETDLPGAIAVAEDLRRRTLSLALPHESSPVMEVVSVSIGVATMVPTAREPGPRNLIDASDQALYAAKSGGRNRVSVAAGTGAPATSLPG